MKFGISRMKQIRRFTTRWQELADFGSISGIYWQVPPAWVQTEEDKDRYIREYEEHEGIKLDPTQIEKKECLRELAKLMLNSFWDKVRLSSYFHPIFFKFIHFSLANVTIWATRNTLRSQKSSLAINWTYHRFSFLENQWLVWITKSRGRLFGGAEQHKPDYRGVCHGTSETGLVRLSR